MINKKFISITVALTVVSFFLTRVIWPDPAGTPMPSAGLIPLFILVNVFECIGFGAGVALLVTAWEKVTKEPWVYGSLIWLLASWWPHDSLHRIGDMQDHVLLLKLEFGFHVTLIIAGLILTHYILMQSRSTSSAH